MKMPRGFKGAVTAALVFLVNAASAQEMKIASLEEWTNDETGHFTYVLFGEGAQQRETLPPWRPTGFGFAGFELADASPQSANAVPVCRFRGQAPNNSLFLTADAAECNALRAQDTGWIYIDTPFKIDIPANGACAPGRTPIHRLYNDRFALGDSNHRFTFDERATAEMVVQGWIDEGVAFCALAAARDDIAGKVIDSNDTPPTALCAQRPEESACIRLRGLPEMTEAMWKTFPPDFTQPNPQYSPDFAAVTGWIPNVDRVWSATFANGAAEAARHSFVEWVPAGQPVGVHVKGSDRIVGDFASISPMYLMGLGAGRIVPFEGPGIHDVDVRFQLLIRTVRRGDAASQAYGGPVLDFVDTTSGLHFLVMVFAYGTQDFGDFVLKDPSGGLPMVATTFRANPSFGTRIAGDFIQCTADGDAGACTASGIDFRFRIDQHDFREILQRVRVIQPVLSNKMEDYAIASFQVRNETFGDAELGLEESAIGLSVSD